MSVKVNYKGEEILSVNTNTTETLKTSGKYCEDDIEIINTQDGGTTITDGIVVKARDTDGYATEVDYYNADEKINRQQFAVQTHSQYFAQAWLNLTKINLRNRVTYVGNYAFYHVPITDFDFSQVEIIENGAFADTSLTGNIVLPEWVTMPNADSDGSNRSTFSGCDGITSIYAPKLQQIGRAWVSGCSNLKEVILPNCTKIYGHSSTTAYGAFSGLTSLTNVQFGSVGHGVTLIRKTVFGNCTQSGLTITAYCNGTYADTLLSNIRNGAINATIIIKASEDTTYGGVSYAAGDTMITSEVE